jgi:hypothetical protein
MHTYLDRLFTDVEIAKQRHSETHVHRSEANAWLEHTGWIEHIGPYKGWVVKMIQPTIVIEDEFENREGQLLSEAALEVACRATAVLIRRSFCISRTAIVGRAAMEYVNRREAGSADPTRPFYGKQQKKTIEKYTDRWMKILRYIWRTERCKKRPAYRLTREQRDALAAFQSSAGITKSDPAGSPDGFRSPQHRQQGMSSLSDTCLTFWIAMFNHRLGDREFQSGIISGLAVLGADTEHGGWAPAINYTPTLAAIITTMRAIVIRKAWQTRRRHIKASMQRGTPISEAEHDAPTVFELVQDDVEQFMTMTRFGGQPTPLNTIYTQKMYGMRVRYTTNAAGQVGWQDNTIIVRKIRFSMDQIRAAVHGMVQESRRRLIEELFVMSQPDPDGIGHPDWKPTALPRFDIGQISDNHAILDAGFSFVNDVRNLWPVDGQRWMAARVVTDPTMRQRFQPSGLCGFDEDAIHAYFRAVRSFKEQLLALVHLSAGAPARATELISIQRENGPDARSHRGVFIDDGLVAFVTSYHKGFSASQSPKTIYRFVPREVSEIVVYYLWLIDPFVRILQTAVDRTFVPGSWMWEPVPEEEWEEFDDEEDSDKEDRDKEDRDKEDRDKEDRDKEDRDKEDRDKEDRDKEDRDKEDKEVGENVPNSRRQARDKIEIESESESEFEDMDNNEDEDKTANAHPGQAERARRSSPPPPPSRNCDGFWDSDRVRRVLRRETTKQIGVAIGTADWRQAYPAIHRELAVNPRIHGTLQQIYDPRSSPGNHAGPDDVDAVRARQSGHSPQMEESIYGRSLQQNPFHTIAEKDAFRRVSVD